MATYLYVPKNGSDMTVPGTSRVIPAAGTTLSIPDSVLDGLVPAMLTRYINGTLSNDRVAISNYNAANATNATVTAYATSLIIKATPGKLIKINGYNSKVLAQFIQIHDSATLPADGAVPAVVINAATVANFSIDFSPNGRLFANGIVICNSSTGPTKTIGLADCWFDAQLG